jgi:hypothetical protein
VVSEEVVVEREEVVAEASPEEVVEEVVEPTPTQPSIDEIADAFASAVKPFADQIENLSAQLDSFKKEIEAMKAEDEERILKAISVTPSASLSALLTQRVIGNRGATVKESEKLSEMKPKETAPEVERRTGVPFIDSMLSRSE